MSTKQILFEINKTQFDTNVNFMNTCLAHITEGYTIKWVCLSIKFLSDEKCVQSEYYLLCTIQMIHYG